MALRRLGLALLAVAVVACDSASTAAGETGEGDTAAAITSTQPTPEPTPVDATTPEPTPSASGPSVPPGELATAEQATAFLDEWVAAWNADDAAALHGVFGDDGVLIGVTNEELVGEDEVAASMGDVWTAVDMTRTGEAVANPDGSFSFDVEFAWPSGRIAYRILHVFLLADGELVRIVERPR
jgi:hypothetical protein